MITAKYYKIGEDFIFFLLMHTLKKIYFVYIHCSKYQTNNCENIYCVVCYDCQSSLFPDQHVQKVQFTVIHVQGSYVHLKEHITCKTNFTN